MTAAMIRRAHAAPRQLLPSLPPDAGERWRTQGAGPGEITFGVLAQHGRYLVRVARWLTGRVDRGPAHLLTAVAGLRLGFGLAFMAALRALQPPGAECRLAVRAVAHAVRAEPGAALRQVPQLENRVHARVGPVGAADRNARGFKAKRLRSGFVPGCAV
jgi:hypothetical protein